MAAVGYILKKCIEFDDYAEKVDMMMACGMDREDACKQWLKKKEPEVKERLMDVYQSIMYIDHLLENDNSHQTITKTIDERIKEGASFKDALKKALDIHDELFDDVLAKYGPLCRDIHRTHDHKNGFAFMLQRICNGDEDDFMEEVAKLVKHGMDRKRACKIIAKKMENDAKGQLKERYKILLRALQLLRKSSLHAELQKVADMYLCTKGTRFKDAWKRSCAALHHLFDKVIPESIKRISGQDSSQTSSEDDDD